MSGRPMDGVNKFYKTYNEHNLALWEQALAEDYVGSVNGQTIANREVGKGFVALLLEAFPDINYTLEDRMELGNRVVIRWRATATHTGNFFGMPPTHKHVSMLGITIFETRDGKVTKLWDVWDQAGLLAQLNG